MTEKQISDGLCPSEICFSGYIPLPSAVGAWEGDDVAKLRLGGGFLVWRIGYFAQMHLTTLLYTR
jgi:hypothetical protein